MTEILITYNKSKNITENCKMYDWIAGKINYVESGLTESKIQEIMTPTSTNINYKNKSVWHNGFITNKDGSKMRLNYNPTYKTLSFGVCPPKYLTGNNLVEQSISTTCDIFTELEHKFGVSLGHAHISNLDVTHTAETQYPAQVYYPYLTNRKGFDRIEWNTTLYYQKPRPRYDIIIYDKIEDLHKREGKRWGHNTQRNIEHEMVLNKNHTRYEYSINSKAHLRNVVGKTQKNWVTLNDIFQMPVIESLHTEWINQWNMIPKNTNISWDFSDKRGESAVKKEIIRVALSQLGRLNIEHMIEEAKLVGSLPEYHQYSRAKASMINLFERQGEMPDHISDLNRRMNEFEPWI